jgi:hypothetical protein
MVVSSTGDSQSIGPVFLDAMTRVSLTWHDRLHDVRTGMANG